MLFSVAQYSVGHPALFLCCLFPLRSCLIFINVLLINWIFGFVRLGFLAQPYGFAILCHVFHSPCFCGLNCVALFNCWSATPNCAFFWFSVIWTVFFWISACAAFHYCTLNAFYSVQTKDCSLHPLHYSFTSPCLSACCWTYCQCFHYRTHWSLGFCVWVRLWFHY